MTIKIHVEKNKDGVYWGTTQNIPGVITADGKTFSEMKRNLKDALELYFESAGDPELARIKDLKNESIEFEFALNLTELFEKFKIINKTKFAERLNINSSLLRQYASKGHIYVSLERAKEIEKGLHSLGEELQAVRL